MSGVRLGPYEIVGPLGSGGMGEVYKARDPRLGRDVAIKVLPAAFSADPERLHRFEQEARAAAALNHPNILAVYDIGQERLRPAQGASPRDAERDASGGGVPASSEEAGVLFIVSELLEGETLRERLSSGALPVRKAVEYAVQIAHGLAAAHEKGITHRDLKPENVFVTGDGRVKILDFGLAKLTQAEPALMGASALPTTPPDTLPGVVLGTIGYMAPEQVRGQTADHRADIFAFGAILYELLSGQRAFVAATQADTISAILDKDPPELPLADRHIPSALARLVDRCLEKNPAARFQSTRDLTFALETVDRQSSASSGGAGHTARRASRERVWMLATATSLLLALMLAWPATLYVRRVVPAPVVTRLDVVTPATGDPFSFALSPDGHQLAFVATAESGPLLWVRSLDQATARPLAATEGASAPFWSPDGHAIGFFADGKLKRVDPGGGAPRVLADAAIPRGGTWNRDNVIVFSPRVNTGLMRVDATGGTPTAVTRLVPGQGTHRWPQFLPDGRQFLFLVALGQPDTRGIYVGSLDGGEPRRVLVADASAAYAPPGYMLVVSEGTLVAYRFDAGRGSISGEPIAVAQSVGVDSGGATGLSAFSVSAAGVLAHRSGATARRQLVWVDRSGKVLGVLGPPDEGAPANPELAPDASRVALLRNVQGNPDIWLLEVRRGITSRFTFDPGVDGSPIWSPDGRRIVFGSARNGRWDLFEKPADGATDEQPLLASTQDKAPQDWSRDGRFLLYAVQDPKTGSDLWALPLTGERKPFLAVQASFDEVHGKFSPDGRWLAYVSNETRGYEVYVRPFPGPGGQRQVSTGGGIFPRWRHDGKELFYLTLDNRVMAVSIQIGSDARTLSPGTSVALFQSPRLAAAGNVGIGSYLSRAPYAVMPDGRFLMIIAADDAVTSPITMVLNWTAGLKK